MLAALLGTRSKPSPAIQKYGNQFLAAITTFTCITITKRAAALTTNLPVQYQLNLSLSGQECMLDQFNRSYYRLINQYSTENPDYLSTTIAQTIVMTRSLIAILQSLPTQNTAAKTILQQQAVLALNVFYSLAIPTNRIYPQ